MPQLTPSGHQWAAEDRASVRPGRRLVFDIETNGFLDQLDQVFSLCIVDADSGERWSCTDECDDYPSIEEGLDLLACAQAIIGHNIIKFDIPAIQKVYPEWITKAAITDTMVLTRLLWPELKRTDAALRKKGRLRMNGKLTGSHSLEAWGYRLGVWKGDYTGGFERWSRAMQDYCEQDITVNLKIFERCRIRLTDAISKKKNLSNVFEWPEEPVQLEHDVQRIVARQERWGFSFDERAATKLWGELTQRRDDLERELRQTFKPWWQATELKETTKTRRVKRKELGESGFERVYSPKTGKRLKDYVGPPRDHYIEGSQHTAVKLIIFNPKSNKQIANRLITLYDWKPTEFTPGGDAKLDDEVISALPYPEAKLIGEYLMVQKRIGQLAEGKQAWLKNVVNGRIHGGVNTMGAVTYRMTHMSPNIAQVPGLVDKKTGAPMPYGKECRTLFMASRGYILCGCDADALELRLLAGYMAAYDGGEYIQTVLNGNKADGTDMHSVNCRALGMDPAKQRETAKTWFYAFIYGAGNAKLGYILGYTDETGAARHGKKSRERFLDNLPALKKLIKAVQKRRKKRGFLIGLDGRKLTVRSDHAALNTLLQSAGAIVMKKALVILDKALQSEGLVPGVDYEFCANVHDEWQIDVLLQHKEFVGQMAEDAIRLAGEHFNFKCPLAGNSDFGSNWAETH